MHADDGGHDADLHLGRRQDDAAEQSVTPSSQADPVLHGAPGTLRANVVQIVMDGLDRRRFVWVAEGREPTPDSPTRAHVRAVTPDYLPTLRIALRQGRGFAP